MGTGTVATLQRMHAEAEQCLRLLWIETADFQPGQLSLVPMPGIGELVRPLNKFFDSHSLAPQ